jgi:hypothetical protein
MSRGAAGGRQPAAPGHPRQVMPDGRLWAILVMLIGMFVIRSWPLSPL